MEKSGGEDSIGNKRSKGEEGRKGKLRVEDTNVESLVVVLNI